MAKKMICEECGADGEGDIIECLDGTMRHWRKPWKDGTIRPLWCDGKFVDVKENK